MTRRRFPLRGILFYDRDCGRGGRDGYLAHYQTWCVEIDGKKAHVHSALIGSPGFPPEQGGPTREVGVKPCDGSCTELVDIDELTTRKALPLIEPANRILAAQEKAGLPAELGQCTYLSELAAMYRRMLEDQKQKRERADAGFDLFLSIRRHLLGWLFRAELNQYEEATRSR